QSFDRGHGHGLLQLGAGEVGTPLPAVFGYWRDFASRYVTALCTLPAIENSATVSGLPQIPLLPTEELETLAAARPPMTGAEYLSAAVLQSLWDDIEDAFRTELADSRRL